MNHDQHVLWEHRQTELWDRVFQATQDVVALVETLEGSAGRQVVWQELIRSATSVGAYLVRANAADDARVFVKQVRAARISSIETDYWLRLVHVLQQGASVQRDLSSLITQYSAVITLLQQFLKDAEANPRAAAGHTKGPRVSL